MNQFQKDIEARGKPSLGATAAVTELVITDDVEGSGDEEGGDGGHDGFFPIPRRRSA